MSRPAIAVPTTSVPVRAKDDVVVDVAVPLGAAPALPLVSAVVLPLAPAPASTAPLAPAPALPLVLAPAPAPALPLVSAVVLALGSLLGSPPCLPLTEGERPQQRRRRGHLQQRQALVHLRGEDRSHRAAGALTIGRPVPPQGVYNEDLDHGRWTA